MEKFESIILITPNIGKQYNNNTFLQPLNGDEIKYLENEIIYEYRSINKSYKECMDDLKDKLGKIKKILEE